MPTPEPRLTCEVCWAAVPAALMYFHRAWHDELSAVLPRSEGLGREREAPAVP